MTAAVSLVTGLLVPENIGANFFELNPARGLAVATLLLAVAAFIAVRIVEEPNVPSWLRAAMVVCTSMCIALLPVAYHGWNRWRGYRLRMSIHDERFYVPAAGAAGFVLAFAILGGCVWWHHRHGATAPAAEAPPTL